MACLTQAHRSSPRDSGEASNDSHTRHACDTGHAPHSGDFSAAHGVWPVWPACTSCAHLFGDLGAFPSGEASNNSHTCHACDADARHAGSAADGEACTGLFRHLRAVPSGPPTVRVLPLSCDGVLGPGRHHAPPQTTRRTRSGTCSAALFSCGVASAAAFVVPGGVNVPRGVPQSLSSEAVPIVGRVPWSPVASKSCASLSLAAAAAVTLAMRQRRLFFEIQNDIDEEILLG
eukprot:g25915.t1